MKDIKTGLFIAICLTGMWLLMLSQGCTVQQAVNEVTWADPFDTKHIYFTCIGEAYNLYFRFEDADVRKDIEALENGTWRIEITQDDIERTFEKDYLLFKKDIFVLNRRYLLMLKDN